MTVYKMNALYITDKKDILLISKSFNLVYLSINCDACFDLNILPKSIKKLRLRNCKIYHNSRLSSLDSISIKNCKIDKCLELYNISKISILNTKNINISCSNEFSIQTIKYNGKLVDIGKFSISNIVNFKITTNRDDVSNTLISKLVGIKNLIIFNSKLVAITIPKTLEKLILNNCFGFNNSMFYVEDNLLTDININFNKHTTLNTLTSNIFKYLKKIKNIELSNINGLEIFSSQDINLDYLNITSSNILNTNFSGIKSLKKLKLINNIGDIDNKILVNHELDDLTISLSNHRDFIIVNHEILSKFKSLTIICTNIYDIDYYYLNKFHNLVIENV